MDDPSKRKQDGKLISEQPHEVRWWTKALGVTKAGLQALVRKFGRSVKRVRAGGRL